MVIQAKPGSYLTLTTGAGGTLWSGLEPQDVLRAIPAAAARIIAIFIVLFGFGLVFRGYWESGALLGSRNFNRRGRSF